MLEIRIHDRPEALRLVLSGELAGRYVRELEGCWATGSSTLGGARVLEIDVGDLSGTDDAGRDLLERLCRAGAQFLTSGSTSRFLKSEYGCRGQAPRTTTAARSPRPFFDKFLTTDPG